MTPSRNKIPRSFLALALVTLVCLSPADAANEWQVIKVGRWDYLTVDNIAKFYGFSADVAPINKTIRLDNGKNQLELTLDSREAIVNGVRNWLCFPVLQNHDGKFLVSRIDLAKTVEPQFRPHMIKNFGHLKTVVIDPGHGGVEKGAASSYGNEKDFTLDVALKLRPLLQAKGFNVIMTREKDELVPLQERARIANATRESIFVSIHFNATDSNASASGFEIYSLTPRGAPSTQDNALLERFLNMQAGSPVDAPSLVLSTSVYHAILGYMPEFDRGVKRARFAVLRLTNIPAILVEGGFLTERQESRLIASPTWRANLAQAISVGLDSYRGLVEKKQRPLLLADYRRLLDGPLVAHNANTPTLGAAAPPPPVLPASNHLAPTARITEALHHEPSEQMSLAETPTDLAEQAVSTPAPPAGNVPSSIEAAEEQWSTARAQNDEATVASAEDDAGAMPDPPDERTETIVSTEAIPSVSAQTPAAPQTRRYWVLNVNPPPKFRE